MIRQNQPFVCRLRHPALFAAHLSTALLLMPVRLARLANGHGPLGRLSVGFRAKSAVFLAGAQKSCFSRWLRKIISKEIAVAIRSGAVLIRNTTSP